MAIPKEELYKKVEENIQRYLNLNIVGMKVQCPYAINIVVPEFLSLMKQAEIEEEKIKEVHTLYKGNKSRYGWYRGKGTPDELEDAFLKISEARNFKVNSPTPKGVREAMKLFGLGVDCSGYIYNILLYSFESLRLEDLFIQSLQWGDKEKTGASKASVDIFAGDASVLIDDLNTLSNLDLLLLKNEKGSYTHMGMVLKESDELKLTQSVVSILPNGVRVDNFRMESGKPVFDFNVGIGTEWDVLYKTGRMEFRRLKILMEV